MCTPVWSTVAPAASSAAASPGRVITSNAGQVPHRDLAPCVRGRSRRASGSRRPSAGDPGERRTSRAASCRRRRAVAPAGPRRGSAQTGIGCHYLSNAAPPPNEKWFGEHRRAAQRGEVHALNHILGEKVSIVSDKPQTTRTQVRGVLTRAEFQTRVRRHPRDPQAGDHARLPPERDRHRARSAAWTLSCWCSTPPPRSGRATPSSHPGCRGTRCALSTRSTPSTATSS